MFKAAAGGSTKAWLQSAINPNRGPQPGLASRSQRKG